ncbi:hypothetical protein [Streptomyces alkaliterrae]|uniref:Helix-turn-helix domain-containing protein n=1 Tax=Streptomyces alkaliterrae TaxID=2213162 RepID=A0A5P0YP38_9ACTN|nr:hypothetical protein [Streptomyces alkaliterrae]MBB1260171.1 hypothetical protein [Streptomyces alkaliterrae]MQS02086.1 hypothetical protein [Streptomyces alkaliterrae]
MTFEEIAAHVGRSTRYVAENTRWGRHPEWPQSIGKRGRRQEFHPGDVNAFIATHHTREIPPIQDDRLYTAREVADLAGFAPDTLWSYVTREQWPPADANGQWWGSTVRRALASRRSYRRTRS